MSYKVYLFNDKKISKEFIKNNIEYAAISKFIPSVKTQKENFELVKNLYKNNLDKFSDILSAQQIDSLKSSEFSAADFDINEFPYFKDFMLDDNTSLVFAFTDKKLNIQSDKARVINFKSDIQKYMTKHICSNT